MTRLARTAAAVLGLLIACSSAAAIATPRSRALWVWDARPLLAGAAGQRQLFDFCAQRGIGVMWIQISTSSAPGGGRTLDRQADWRVLLAEAHRTGLSVHALDGDPRYSRRDQHAVPFGIIDAIAAFNAASPQRSRFDGIHFDNEPYLLPEWQDTAVRARVLEEFVDLNTRAQARAHAAGLEYGVDIPFWWQEQASLQWLRLVDNFGIMDYRNVAAGGDGIVAHAEDLLAYADRGGHARAYVGVETSTVVAAGLTFAGKSNEEMEKELSAAETQLAPHASYAGIAVHHWDSYRAMAGRASEAKAEAGRK